MAKKPKFKFEAEKLARALPIMTGVLALGYLLAAYALLFMPKLGRMVAGGQLDTAPFVTAISDEKAYQSQLKAQTKSFNALNPVQREKALGLVTAEPDFPGLLVQVSELCQRHQATCPSVNVALDDTVLPGSRKSVRLALNVTGLDYAGMKSFLSDVERSRRLFDAESVIFSPGSQSVSVSLRAYYLTREQPPVTGAAPAAAPAATP
jgi:hypothetical protein